MSEIISTIKKAALEAVTASSPSKLIFGKISSLNPLSIKIEQSVVLTESFLSVGSVVQNLILNDKVNVGDQVAILSENGGQRFFVIDALVDK